VNGVLVRPHRILNSQSAFNHSAIAFRSQNTASRVVALNPLGLIASVQLYSFCRSQGSFLFSLVVEAKSSSHGVPGA
jgi:hypothetical protein